MDYFLFNYLPLRHQPTHKKAGKTKTKAKAKPKAKGKKKAQVSAAELAQINKEIAAEMGDEWDFGLA